MIAIIAVLFFLLLFEIGVLLVMASMAVAAMYYRYILSEGFFTAHWDLFKATILTAVVTAVLSIAHIVGR